LLVAWGCATATPSGTSGEQRAAAWLDAHRDRPPMLRMFLQRMPKGGDIHTHVSGAVYAESYIEWAAADPGLCFDATRGTIARCCPPACPTRPVADALRDGAFYSKLVDALSTRNLAKSPQVGHDQFFASFSRFGEAGSNRAPQMVAELATRAADQNILYLELMTSFRAREARELGARTAYDGDFAATRARLRSARTAGGQDLDDLVKAARADVEALDTAVLRELGCRPDDPPGSCKVARRYLQQITRTLDPGVVFSQLVFAFELARAERRVVGLNLVAPEDDRIALRDYRQQMRMIGWLAEQYPGVNIALHAGELALGLVPPADLRFHIREAVEVGKARRIGHGVAIHYERDAPQLLATMAEREVLVEICLTSNDVILGVKGASHPFPDYLRAGVPVTLASDDEGVSRIDLTNEYVRATETYRLRYEDLKRLSRNSVTYSFLAGPSLWATRALEPVPQCRGDRPGGSPSGGCREFLDGSDKARMQWALERAFEEFEALPWLSGGR
jgi:adenosine deaminase/adenosine deaminase CECR1